MIASSPVITEPLSTILNYSIAGCSEHSGKYAAENIMVDSPMDQASRWSGAHQTSNVKQWMLLRLESLSIVKSITFGKYYKAHPCNMKEFKLFIGMSEDHMIEVLHRGLKNDAVPETFTVKHVNDSGVYVPSRYVKIVPLSAHGQSFHTSIWHVSMIGIADAPFLEQVRLNYDKCRETSVLRHILKHLRQRRLLTPYSSILSHTRIRLEHPLVTQLYRHIVLEGSWEAAEATLHQASAAGLFDAYRRACQPHAVWTELRGTDADGDAPAARGGHAMCIDSDRGMIYLFGGWDGRQNLDDFWVYDIARDMWRVLSHATSIDKNGPGPRSCHKMVFDVKSGCIYLLGRLTDGDALRGGAGQGTSGNGAAGSAETREGGGDAPAPAAANAGEVPTTTAFCSEFYRYHTRGLDAGTWDLLSFDTASSGGPPLIFDHQMVMDSDTQMLYVFGGRVVDGDWNSNKYSGLYSYNVRTSKWKLLQPADFTSVISQCHIPARFGHSMVLSPPLHTLFIFAGQRDDKYLSDIYAFDLRTNTAREVCASFTTAGMGGPDACFTQRAVIDVELEEIYMFCGQTRSPQNGSKTVLRSDELNWVYRYGTGPGKWAQILPESMGEDDEREVEAPLPRYAHQVVYNPQTRTFYLHGGDSGEGAEKGEGSSRLDDFWRMTLTRPVPGEIVRSATYRLRRQHFREMCEELPAIQALNFLQKEVSSVVDHSDPEETKTFRSLLSHLLAPPTSVQIPEKVPVEVSTPQTPDSDSPWTSVLDEDAIMGDAQAISSLKDGSSAIEEEDPEERAIRGEAPPLSAARFQQRTEVFEALLEFVEDGEKQPIGSLLDMVNGEVGVEAV